MLPVLLGGAGNMMFQVASLVALAKDYNLEPIIGRIHKGTIHANPKKYESTLFRKVSYATWNDYRNTASYYNSVSSDAPGYYPVTLPKNTNVQLHGSYQSYKYFDKYSSEIVDLFSPTEEQLSYIHKQYASYLINRPISLHVRRGDYKLYPKVHPILPLAYYLKALEIFPQNKKVLVFSDEVAYTKKMFTGDRFIFIEKQDELIDLYLMSMCSGHIIANSTFSWWGAWLSAKTNTVVAPRMWFGVNGPKFDLNDLILPNWILI